MQAELTEIDVEILTFIEARGSADIESIKNKFRDIPAIEYRVKVLSTPEYFRPPSAHFSIPKSNTSYLRESVESVIDSKGFCNVKHLGIYQLTEFGEKELQDYRQRKKSDLRELWLKNAWIPMLVTLATNLLISGIKWLLPLIQQWLSSTS